MSAIAIIIIVICILLGYLKPEYIFKVLIGLIVGLLLLSLVYCEWTEFYANLAWRWQIVTLILLPLTLLILLKFLFPKTAWLSRLQQALFDALVYCLTFPIRLVWRASRQIFHSERRRVRLRRHRPVVGGSPPLRMPERKNFNSGDE